MPTYRNLVELRVESLESGATRNVIVGEDIPLFQLHRVLQFCFMKKVAPISRMEAMKPEFTYKGQELRNSIKATSISKAPGEAFLKGRGVLQYVPVPGKATYAIKALRRGNGDGKYYVPRCIKGSQEADLDTVNSKLMTNRFSKDAGRNRVPKTPPTVWCSRWAPDDVIWQIHLHKMRESLKAQEKRESC